MSSFVSDRFTNPTGEKLAQLPSANQASLSNDATTGERLQAALRAANQAVARLSAPRPALYSPSPASCGQREAGALCVRCDSPPLRFPCAGGSD